MARILLCHEFFWPDAAPYGSILKAIGEHWSAHGHEVLVFTSQPDDSRSLGGLSYETEDGATALNIVRASLPFSSKSQSPIARIANSIVFAAKFVNFARRSKPIDVVMNSTMPPLFAGVAGALAAKIAKAKWIYHLMDIFPEVINHTPGFRAGALTTFFLSLLRRVDTFACSKAERLIVLSGDMRATLLQRPGRGIKGENIDVMPNFAVPNWSEPSDALAQSVVDWSDDASVKLVFVGNLGRFQGLESLLTGFLSLPTTARSAELAFVGDGLVVERLKHMVSQAGAKSIHFTGLLSRSGADSAMLASDICVVSLAPGIERVAFPTKLSSYLVHRKPLLVLGKIGSSLQRLVEENGVGCFADIESDQSIREALISCMDTARRREWNRAAADHGKKYLPENMYPFWDDTLNKLLNDASSR